LPVSYLHSEAKSPAGDRAGQNRRGAEKKRVSFVLKKKNPESKGLQGRERRMRRA